MTRNQNVLWEYIQERTSVQTIQSWVTTKTARKLKPRRKCAGVRSHLSSWKVRFTLQSSLPPSLTSLSSTQQRRTRRPPWPRWGGPARRGSCWSCPRPADWRWGLTWPTCSSSRARERSACTLPRGRTDSSWQERRGTVWRGVSGLGDMLWQLVRSVLVQSCEL